MDVRSLAVFLLCLLMPPTNCSSDAVKDSFYDALDALLRRTKSSDIVVVAGDMNAQVGKLNTDEAQLGGCLGLDSVRRNDFSNYAQVTSCFYAARTFATKMPVCIPGTLQIPVNGGPQLTMWPYSTDGAARSLTVDLSGTLL